LDFGQRRRSPRENVTSVLPVTRPQSVLSMIFKAIALPVYHNDGGSISQRLVRIYWLKKP
jgi:hypothetical protein